MPCAVQQWWAVTSEIGGTSEDWDEVPDAEPITINLVQDSFTGADGSIEGHNPDVGFATWNQGLLKDGQLSVYISLAVNAWAGISSFTETPEGAAGFVLAFDHQHVEPNGAGVLDIFISSGLRFLIDSPDTAIFSNRVRLVDDVLSTLASGTLPDGGERLTLRVLGNQIDLYADDTLVLSHTADYEPPVWPSQLYFDCSDSTTVDNEWLIDNLTLDVIYG